MYRRRRVNAPLILNFGARCRWVVHNSLPLDYIPIQINPLYTTIKLLFKLRFSNILSSTRKFFNWSLQQILVHVIDCQVAKNDFVL